MKVERTEKVVLFLLFFHRQEKIKDPSTHLEGGVDLFSPIGDFLATR